MAHGRGLHHRVARAVLAADSENRPSRGVGGRLGKGPPWQTAEASSSERQRPFWPQTPRIGHVPEWGNEWQGPRQKCPKIRVPGVRVPGRLAVDRRRRVQQRAAGESPPWRTAEASRTEWHGPFWPQTTRFGQLRERGSRSLGAYRPARRGPPRTDLAQFWIGALAADPEKEQSAGWRIDGDRI